MKEYYIPAKMGEAEFTEKRSRFIGHVWPVSSEEQARAKIEQMRARYHDARHNCWCYRLREGGLARYSDDGEPQGTAGQPMLEVFTREDVTDACCVVTRYFGGILLGAGGLLRAYTRSAKAALDAAGISVVRCLIGVAVGCPYSFLERVQLAVGRHDGEVVECEYGAEVIVHALLPEIAVEPFSAQITELTAGGARVVINKELQVPRPQER